LSIVSIWVAPSAWDEYLISTRSNGSASGRLGMIGADKSMIRMRELYFENAEQVAQSSGGSSKTTRTDGCDPLAQFFLRLSEKV
jgi:hypothetical protein